MTPWFGATAGVDEMRRRGDDQEFAALASPHVAVMAGLARRLVGPADAEDVVQDALLMAWRHQRDFDPARGTARVWLLTLTANAAARSRRWHRRHPTPVSAYPGPDPDPYPTFPDEHELLDLRAAVGTLSGRQRLAVELYYYLDLPIADVAAVMHCSAGTVKSTLADARSRLHQILGRDR